MEEIRAGSERITVAQLRLMLLDAIHEFCGSRAQQDLAINAAEELLLYFCDTMPPRSKRSMIEMSWEALVAVVPQVQEKLGDLPKRLSFPQRSMSVHSSRTFLLGPMS